jgi:anti-sigma regulatory factor (Ser/Thr protein kinase)
MFARALRGYSSWRDEMSRATKPQPWQGSRDRPWTGRRRPPVELELTLEHKTSSIPAARATTRSFFARWVPEGRLASLELIVSELVTNSLLHAGIGPIRLRLVADREARIEVVDQNRGPTVPHVKPLRPGEIGGLGLHVVSALAEAWGSEVRSSERTVWASTPL